MYEVVTLAHLCIDDLLGKLIDARQAHLLALELIAGSPMGSPRYMRMNVIEGATVVALRSLSAEIAFHRLVV